MFDRETNRLIFRPAVEGQQQGAKMATFDCFSIRHCRQVSDIRLDVYRTVRRQFILEKVSLYFDSPADCSKLREYIDSLEAEFAASGYHANLLPVHLAREFEALLRPGAAAVDQAQVDRYFARLNFRNAPDRTVSYAKEDWCRYYVDQLSRECSAYIVDLFSGFISPLGMTIHKDPSNLQSWALPVFLNFFTNIK